MALRTLTATPPVLRMFIVTQARRILYGTTGPECRDDCQHKRSGVGIAANLRTARRERPSRVASVGQDPNSAVPVAHLPILLSFHNVLRRGGAIKFCLPAFQITLSPDGRNDAREICKHFIVPTPCRYAERFAENLCDQQRRKSFVPWTP